MLQEHHGEGLVWEIGFAEEIKPNNLPRGNRLDRATAAHPTGLFAAGCPRGDSNTRHAV